MINQLYTISVKEAIRKGRLNLVYIPKFFMISGFVGFLLFVKFFMVGPQPPAFNPVIAIILIPLAGFILGSLWRGFHSAAWKIWALENVQDVHRLYHLAFIKGMINKPDGWLNKLEYKTAEQRARLAHLELRLDEPRQIEQPSLTPVTGDQHILGYSLEIQAYKLLMLLPVLGLLFYSSGKLDLLPLGIFLVVALAMTLYKWIPRIGKPAPLRFDLATLTIKDNPPVPWHNIIDIYLEKRPEEENYATMLVVQTNTASKIDLNVTDIEKGPEAIEQVLYDYWVRSKLKTA